MAKKRTLARDLNQLAKAIVDSATGEQPPIQEADQSGKNPAAVALGRLGGLKGGKARASKLSKTARKRIAKKAAEARWEKSKPATKDIRPKK